MDGVRTVEGGVKRMAATILQDKGQIAMLTVVTPGVLAPQSHPIGCIKPTAGVQRI